MPKYAYYCEPCNLIFERTLKMGLNPHYTCPECQEKAPREWDGEDFGLQFAAPPDRHPADSGVHHQDYPTADRAVGASAEKRWLTYEEKKAVKAKARREGQTHALIRHDGDGFIDYEPMSLAGREARKKMGKDAFKALEAQKAAMPSAKKP